MDMEMERFTMRISRPRTVLSRTICSLRSHMLSEARSVVLLLEDGAVAEGLEGVPLGLVELGLELHPMQTQDVQEALHDVHAQQDRDRDDEPNTEPEVHREDVQRERRGHTDEEGVPEEDHGELLVRERERPETEIGSRVRDRSQDVLDGLDHLVDHQLREVKVLPLFFLDGDMARLLVAEWDVTPSAVAPAVAAAAARVVRSDLLLVFVILDHWLGDQQARHREHRDDHQDPWKLGA